MNLKLCNQLKNLRILLELLSRGGDASKVLDVTPSTTVINGSGYLGYVIQHLPTHRGFTVYVKEDRDEFYLALLTMVKDPLLIDDGRRQHRMVVPYPINPDTLDQVRPVVEAFVFEDASVQSTMRLLDDIAFNANFKAME